MANTFLGGTLSFMIGGVPYRLGGNFKIKLGGLLRDDKVGLSGPLGYTSKYGMSSIECEMVTDGSISVAALKGVNNVTLVALLDNGRTYMLPGAWQSGDDPSIDVKEAMTTVTFSALSAQEM
jgi:hypothetical protein